MRLQVLALDVEGTLISNAVSQIPRPGLYAFLSRCSELFPRIVIFTVIEEARFRSIARTLVAEGFAPNWFTNIEYINWHGTTKNLNFIPNIQPYEVVLIDDMELYVHPGQESQWLKIDNFDYKSQTIDTELAKISYKLGHMHIGQTVCKLQDKNVEQLIMF